MIDISYADTAQKIADDLQSSGEKVITYSWSKFYSVCEASKLHQVRKDGIRDALWDDHELLMVMGDKVVLVARDSYINRVK